MSIPDWAVAILQSREKLNVNNFPVWKRIMRSFFVSVDAKYLLDPPDTVPAGAEKIDVQLDFVIKATLEDEDIDLVSELFSALEVWKKITSHYERLASNLEMSRQTKMQAERYVPGQRSGKAKAKAQSRHNHGGGTSNPVDKYGFRWSDTTSNGCCNRCGRPGHTATYCWTDMPQHVTDWILNSSGRKEKQHSRNNTVEMAVSAGFVPVW